MALDLMPFIKQAAAKKKKVVREKMEPRKEEKREMKMSPKMRKMMEMKEK